MEDSTLKLKDYIELTLKDLCEAIESVRNDYNYVAPKIHSMPDKSEKATMVDFDVAVTVNNSASEQGSAEGKIGAGFNISVLKLEAGIKGYKQGSEENSLSQHNRVKFSVPVYFQYDKVKHDEQIRTRKENKNYASERSGSVLDQ